jgi:hypothetical protein
MKKLTVGQATAFYVLLQGRNIGRLVPTGKESSDTDGAGEPAPHNLRVNRVAVRALKAMGYARSHCVLIDGRRLKGAALVHYLGHWKEKFEVTERGRRAWVAATARERWGLPEVATMQTTDDLAPGRLYLPPRRAV